MFSDMYADLLEKGYACIRRGDPHAACSRFQHAIACEPERPQAYFALAQACLEQELDDDAKQALETALRVDPTYCSCQGLSGH